MPLDHIAPHGGSDNTEQLAISDDHLFPNTKIFRDFQFGANLHLLLTDYRTNRPDHLIPEDAFPGALAMDSATITGFLQSAGQEPAYISGVLASLSPVIDIDEQAYAYHKTLLTAALVSSYTSELTSRLNISESDAQQQAAQKVTEVLVGKQTSSYLNQVMAQAQATLADEHPLKNLPPLPETGVDTGLAYYTMGKTTLFSDLGARYLVIKPTFDLFAAYKGATDPSSQSAYSTEQMTWLATTITNSGATNKVVGSSVSAAPLLADLSATRQPLADPTAEATLAYILGSGLVPEPLKQQFYLNVDHWDGFPQGKEALVKNVFEANGVITLSGDIHSSFVTEHQYTDGSTKAVDFTTSSVSSGTFGEFLSEGLDTLLAQLGDIPDGIDALKALFDDIALASSTSPGVQSSLALAKMGEHGVSIATASNTGFKVEYHNVKAELATTGKSYYNKRSDYLSQVNKHAFNWDGTVLTDISNSV